MAEVIKIPVQQCVYVAKNNLEKPFQLYLLLKFFYPTGKSKLVRIEKQALLNQLPYKDLRSLNANIERLKEIGWLKQNSVTGYYQILSIHKLREQNDWASRAGIEADFKGVFSIPPILGFAIYTYLYIDFWRKVKRDKSVRLKGRTYHFIPSSSKSFTEFAPIATTGVKALFGISTKKASFLKHEASSGGFISVKKDYEDLPYSYSMIKRLVRSESIVPNVRKIKGKYQLQLIDQILPHKHLIRLKKMPKI
ncbi:hypothetical protein [Fluviicola taffensis]|uniref:Uncharacterized protein n=1 Tax=Fluviicola taffensis (strain DSM 16823 / NCIMB 13979 / RW262) TaxID=755732 RepID=F2IEY2_FLUTR|nr:hypothetical protein [Fluviicola taffensis]AEA42447.1 hypothetical protein Fluta_0441 [Fluviicola taffensis DSM 16823]